ncbi:MAG: DUF86 domain-containing protein [Blastocatellia bacterium]|nr:DUF86 domain-containing protein [Candidatus Kapabacteria bacterium]MCS7158656.1 DUF86 domain-containing protein [Blastocatellia bacterium]MDW8166905.1 DUF86 domain-containing protein [Acidobacteriota bacterium]
MSIAEKYRHLPPLPGDLRERLGRLPSILQRHSVRLAYLFGSAAYALERCEDVDIAVLPDEGFSYTELYAEISLALDTDRLDLVDLRLAPPYLVAEILRQGHCILARSEEERARFEIGKHSEWRENRHWWLRRMQKEEKMDIRPEFLMKALAELERIAQELEKYQQATEEQLATNLSLRWTIERGLLAGLTVVFQVADHILAQAFGRTPSSYEELIAELCAIGVVSEELYHRMRGSGGFRNVLVHEYVMIDLAKVVEALRGAPETFRMFRQEILQWVQHHLST